MSTLLLQLALGQFGDVFYFVYKLYSTEKSPDYTLSSLENYYSWR